MINKQHINGAAAELYVASKLAENSWNIYFPFMSQSRCDLIAEKGKVLQKVQVKKLTWAYSGTNQYLSTRLKSRNKHSQMYEDGDFDILALTDMERIWLIPFEEVKEKTSIQVDKRGPTVRSGYNRFNQYMLKQLGE